MKKYKIFSSLITLLVFICADTYGESGEAAGITLTKPVTASQAVLYNAVSGDTGLKTFGVNPAGLTGLEKRELSFMYNRGHFEDDFVSATYGQQIYSVYIGANVIYRTTGKVGIYTSGGEYVKEIGQEDTVFSLTASLPGIPGYNMPVGINLTMLESSIFGYSATSYLIDAGTQKTINFKNSNLRLGASLRNLGTKLKYLEKYSDIPSSMQTGLKYSIAIGEDKLSANSDLNFPLNSKDIYLMGGLDYKVILNTEGTFTRGGVFDSLTFMTGGKMNINSENSNPRINLGLEIETKPYTFSYVMNLVQDINLGHYISLGFKL
ncbi:MAG: hypothetical protein ACQEQC_00320 [Elusimicrobiota bacterium]